MSTEVEYTRSENVLNVPGPGEYINGLNSDGTVQNPSTKAAAAESKKLTGKSSTRRIAWTIWSTALPEGTDIDVWRNEEFERLCDKWQLTLKCLVFGPWEKGEENKAPHFHAYAFWKRGKSWETIHKVAPTTIYYHDMKKRNASVIDPPSYIEYCWKNSERVKENTLIYGKLPCQGERNDLKEMLKECDYNIEKIQDNYPDKYCRWKPGLTAICERKKEKRDFIQWCNWEKDETGRYRQKKEYTPPKVMWLYGDSGTGKTMALKNTLEDLQDAKDINWDIDRITRISGFENGFAMGKLCNETDILILDEFRGDWMKYGKLLSLIDGDYVNKKGTQIYIQAKYVIITSALRPEECYPTRAANDKIKQLMRRITKLGCTGRTEDGEGFDDEY